MHNTEIAVKSIGIKLPDAPQSEHDTTCACCGRQIQTGDPYHPLDLSGAFMDDAWFVSRSGVSCPWCNAMLSSLVSKKLGSANAIVYTDEGAFPIAKDNNRTWFLLNPPKTPFVVTASATINFQHVVWKAPVSLSPDMIFIAWPTRIMTIRHKVLMRAVEACSRISLEVVALKESANNDPKSKKKKAPIKALSHPYICLDRNLGDLNHGAIRPDIRELAAQSKTLAADLALLETLSLGETWALSTLVKAKPEVPEKPEPLKLDPNTLLTSK